MESFYQRFRNLIVLVLALAIQVVALAIQVKQPSDPSRPQGDQVRLIRLWIVGAVTPLEDLFIHGGASVRRAWANYVYLRGLREENRNLKAELDRLHLEETRLSEDAQQAHRLQRLLAFREQYIGQTIPAQVVGTSGAENSRVVYIDKGSQDGIQVNMPVITPDGVVGKINKVYPSSSQVLEINDPSSGAGVMLSSSRLRGILRGGPAGFPEIVNIMADEKVINGDQVLTSGGDSIFPPGLPVGNVERVYPDRDRDLFLAIEVKPSANLDRLEEVLVISKIDTKVPETEGASVDEREADKLAGNLPAIDASAQPTVSDEEPARPQPPLQPAHPDRFTPPAGSSSVASVPAKVARPAKAPAASPLPAGDSAPDTAASDSQGASAPQP